MSVRRKTIFGGAQGGYAPQNAQGAGVPGMPMPRTQSTAPTTPPPQSQAPQNAMGMAPGGPTVPQAPPRLPQQGTTPPSLTPGNVQPFLQRPQAAQPGNEEIGQMDILELLQGAMRI